MLRHLAELAPRLLAAAAFAVLAAGGAQAQKIRPGLWENAVTVKSSGGQVEAAMAQMRAQLASMPPEQRAQVEAMMARQGVGMAAGKPNTVRTCISPEMAARDEFNPGDSRCKSTSFSRSGNTVRFKFACEHDRGTANGEGEYTLVSDTETRGKMFVNTTQQGQSMRMDMESAGRWLGANCGDIKPIGGKK
ncbi:MAG: DUF3617 domain-containing protein [Rubrivivax sp.]|nr:DUF3617 domain-containing protein [Rubrivivax sp.]